VNAVVGDSEVNPRDLRVSDAERAHVAGLLERAVGHGLITLDECVERTDRILAARTRGQLNAVLADLPFMRNKEMVVDDAPLVLRTRSGSLRQDGYWTVPSEITADCGLGRITIDFTTATCPHAEVTLRADCGAGNIVVIVPRGWHVMLASASSRMGSVVNKANDPPRPGLPVLRVTANAGTGHVKIRHPR
jgi:hypothetical protein